jgi:formate hydrogenlyase subunit 6/NADH:ubiquinone oxidoreductase subunit I
MGKNPTETRAKNAIKENESVLFNFIESLKKREISSKDFKSIIGDIEYKLWKDYYKNKDKKFNVNDNCIGCSMCKKICPVENIIIENNKPKWSGNCTDCMGCINICPKEAINIGKSTIKKNRYLNPYIKREELL